MNKAVSKILLFVIIISFLNFFNLNQSVNAADIFNVKQDGSGDYTSIQNAVDDASEGSTIIIYNGTYYENLVINKSVIIKGEDKINTFINADGGIAFDIKSDEIEISDLTILNADIGIFIDNQSKNEIHDNTITDNNYGIFINNSSFNNIIHLNNFIDNTVNAFDNSSNKWYSQLRGNYWSDYEGSDNNDDGIGDNPYNISGGNNIDNYPYINPLTEKPYVDFTYSPVYITTNMEINFFSDSYDNDGYIESWFWDFGDNNSSDLINTTHKYVDDGYYNVSLTVFDNYGYPNSIMKQVRVLNVRPEADFSYSPENPTDLVNISFIDLSNDTDGRIANWIWDFGNGDLSYEKNPKIKYDDDGTYTINLTVFDDDGASDIKSKKIVILNVPPNAKFDLTPSVTITDNDTVKFTDKSEDYDGKITMWEWMIDGVVVSSEKNLPSKKFGWGSHTISLTVWDDDGEKSEFTKKIDVISVTGRDELIRGFDLTSIIFIVFIIIMVAMVILLSRKFGLK